MIKWIRGDNIIDKRDIIKIGINKGGRINDY